MRFVVMQIIDVQQSETMVGDRSFIETQHFVGVIIRDTSTSIAVLVSQEET